MKTTFSAVLTMIFIGCAIVAHSTVLRVNNTPAITVPYATLQAAYDAAADGDTIYIEGSGTSYGSLSLYKKLVIIGTGYFLNENPETQANIAPSTVSQIYCYTGSSGSKFIGLNVGGFAFYAPNLQDFVVLRNNITSSLTTNYGVSNVLVEQNMIGSMDGRYENTIIRNNWFSYMNIYSNNNSLAVFNNVFSYYITLSLAQFYNNIIYATNNNFTNCVTSNNVCSATQLPAGNGNQQNVNMNDVFVCYTTCTGYSTDARYQLKAGSPAIGAGNNGEDCGMFGGGSPYMLSGMPPIPAIYYFLYNFNNASINVNMKVKSHN
ncbi:MAG: hypothetical protein NT004_09350 [Bacteroidetes bacterium]|nr:hypothetical protein [Bacteroidota bacterium]